MPRCADTHRHTHAHGRARRPREPTQQQHFGETKQAGSLWNSASNPLPAPGIKEEREWGRAGRKPPRPGPHPGRDASPGQAVPLTPRTPRGRCSAARTRGALAALGSSPQLRRVRRNHRLPSRPASLPRPPRSDVRRLGAGYLWPGYSEFSLGRVLIAVPWDL